MDCKSLTNFCTGRSGKSLTNCCTDGSQEIKKIVVYGCFGMLLLAVISCTLPFVILSEVRLGLGQHCCNLGTGHQVGQLPRKKVDEASGLAVSKSGVLWTHNDDIGDSRVFGLDKKGNMVATVTLDGVDAVDWEDIALKQEGGGGNFLYVADTGDNKHKRDHISIYRFPEPDLNSLRRKKKKKRTMILEDYETLEMVYPDSEKFDNEALAVDPQSGDIFLFTKNRQEALSHVFRYPAPQSPEENPFTLHPVTTLPLFWVTGGDISADGDILVITNKHEAFCWNKTGEAESWMEHLASHQEPCRLVLEEEEQREAVAVTREGIWTTSEGHGKATPIWFYPWGGDGKVGENTTITNEDVPGNEEDEGEDDGEEDDEDEDDDK